MIGKYNDFAKRIEELELERDVDAKPILDVSNIPDDTLLYGSNIGVWVSL